MRSRLQNQTSAVHRERVRAQIFREAGALDYDQIEHEFRAIAGQLEWPRAATLKDFRHLFSTCLENAGVPEFYRRYFMGQSPGKTAIAVYTHMNELNEQYSRYLRAQLSSLSTAIVRRFEQLFRHAPP